MANEKLISASALANVIRDDPYIHGRAYARMRDHISDAPAVDAVEVVRCGECENAVSFSWTAAGEKVHGFRCMKDDGAIGYKCVVSGDDFCASGKRRTENAND